MILLGNEELFMNAFLGSMSLPNKIGSNSLPCGKDMLPVTKEFLRDKKG